MTRVFITGAAGCLGSNIAERLEARGVAVMGLDNYATGRRDAPSAARIVEGDIRDAALVDRLFAEFRPTHVIHAAASYNDPDDWLGDIATNVAGTVNVARAAQQAGVAKIVYLQTALCYGAPLERPVSVNHRFAPFTSYAISKAAGEQYLAMSGVPSLSLRIANVYGPRAFTGPIPIFYKRLRAGQACFVTDTRRDFIEMDDFLDLMDRVLADPEMCGALNVSSGSDVSILTLFETMTDIMGVRLTEPVKVVPPAADDVATLLLDPSETEARLGWTPRIGLREGLERQIAWFDRNGVGETFTHLSAARG